VPVIPEPKDLFQHLDDILAEMKEVLVVRGRSYADIRENSAPFAALMGALGVEPTQGFTEVQFHCLSNIATKLARFVSGNRNHEDNLLDAANYILLMLADMRRTKEHAEIEAMIARANQED
jgi:hypothetical protein